MQTMYAIFERQDAGGTRRVGEIEGSLRERDHGWEMVTNDGLIPGTLEGHPLSSHVFTDHQGREYRVI